jgi:hypothetical protein
MRRRLKLQVRPVLLEVRRKVPQRFLYPEANRQPPGIGAEAEHIDLGLRMHSRCPLPEGNALLHPLQYVAQFAGLGLLICGRTVVVGKFPPSPPIMARMMLSASPCFVQNGTVVSPRMTRFR